MTPLPPVGSWLKSVLAVFGETDFVAAIRRASSLLSNFAAERRPGSSSK
jgi:hypothetical protein